MKSDIVIGKKIIHIFYTKTTSEQKKYTNSTFCSHNFSAKQT